MVESRIDISKANRVVVNIEKARFIVQSQG